MEDTNQMRPCKSTEKNLHELTETEAAVVDIACAWPGPQCRNVSFQFNNFMDPWVCEWVGLYTRASFWLFSFDWFALPIFNVTVFLLHYILFYYCLLETCSFLKKDRKQVDMNGRRGGEAMRGTQEENINHDIEYEKIYFN